MFRRIAAALVLLLLLSAIASAEDFHAVIKKVEDKKVTFFRRIEPQDGEKNARISKTEETMPTTADVKVIQGKFNRATRSIEPGDDLPGGLSNEHLKNIDQKKGLAARIITDDSDKKIKEIRVFIITPKKKS